MAVEYQKKIKTWSILNFVLFILVIFVNYLGATGFFNGMSQAQVSAKYPTMITPAGFTFSIWGVIYGLLFLTLLLLLIKRKAEKVSNLIGLISPLFLFNCIFNIGWIIAFSFELIGLSVVFIFLILITLMMIIQKIYKHRFQVAYLLPAISFTVYASWLFIATIVNIGALLVKWNWNGFGISRSLWAMLVIVFATLFVIFYMMKYKNALFPISIAWAFFGIYSKYQSGEMMADMGTGIRIFLILGMITLVAMIVTTFIKNGKSLFPKAGRNQSIK